MIDTPIRPKDIKDETDGFLQQMCAIYFKRPMTTLVGEEEKKDYLYII